MAKAGYSVVTSGAIASGTSAKTILAILAGSAFGMELKGFSVSFEGTTQGAAPVLVELCYLTAASNSTPGTGNTSRSSAVQQTYGRQITHGFGAFEASTSEPTVLTALEAWTITPYSSTVERDLPLMSAWDAAPSQGFAYRVTAGASVPTRATFHFERV